MNRLSRRLARQLGIQILLLIGTLAAAELILRIVDLRELRVGLRVGDAIVHRFHPELGWYPAANTVVERKSLIRTVTVATNSLGLRDIEHDQVARPTVLVLGDSFVWGEDVEADERFTEIIRKQFPGLRIVNAGVSGYGTDQEFLLLQRLWDRFKPDVVVLIFCTENDRTDNTSNIIVGGYYKPYVIEMPDGQWRMAGQPVPMSRHVYFRENPVVRNSWLARAAVAGYIRFRHPRIMVPDPTEHLVAMMRDFVAERRAKFFVGIQRSLGEPLANFLETQNIPYVSFDGAEQYHGGGDHWTPAGHRTVAERLRPLLAESALPATH